MAVTPSAKPRKENTMQKWEYLNFFTKCKMLEGGYFIKDHAEFEGKRIDEVFNKLGEEGWELVTSVYVSSLKGPSFVLKRPKQ